jgi:hypothetical protein
MQTPPTVIDIDPICMLKRHNGSMPNVQIKNVPETAHAVLRERAARSRQSLQEA